MIIFRHTTFSERKKPSREKSGSRVLSERHSLGVSKLVSELFI